MSTLVSHVSPYLTSQQLNASVDEPRTIAEPHIIPSVGRVQDVSYHAAPTKETTVLETDLNREYGDFDAGDHVGRHRDVDAGNIHADRNRDAGVDERTGRNVQEKNFGGENTDYDDVVSPEDDDETQPEDFESNEDEILEEAIESGEPVDATTSDAIFPGSDKW